MILAESSYDMVICFYRYTTHLLLLQFRGECENIITVTRGYRKFTVRYPKVSPVEFET